MKFLSGRVVRLAVTAGGVAVLVSIICGYLFDWSWTGVAGHELWDWIELLIVPLGLALVALLFNSWERLQVSAKSADLGPSPSCDVLSGERIPLFAGFLQPRPPVSR